VGAQLQLTIAGVRGDDDFPIVAFAEVGSRDAAEALRGYVLEIPSSQLPELDDDEYYPFDLAGLEARDPQGRVVGRVAEVVESPAHAILVVSLGPGCEAMVPFVHDAVPVVAVSEGHLVIEPGFLVHGADNVHGADDVDGAAGGKSAGGASQG